MARTKTCGDCIHAKICKQVNGGWFSPKNIAYCTAFLDREDVSVVVRCKDCKHFWESFSGTHSCKLHKGLVGTKYDTFCSYGERRTDETKTD